MYCPACDKEFSPVHSRCPECKGWLRVSGPVVGAKAAIIPLRPPSAVSLESATTQKVGPKSVPLPARPKPAGESAEPAARAASLPGPGLQTATERVETSGRGALGTGWEASSNFSAPSPAPVTATPAPSPSTWGAPAPSASGPAAVSGWGSPTGGWGTPAPEAPKATGWGSGQPTPFAAPAPVDTHGNGAHPLGGGNGGFAPTSSGPGFAGGLSSGPASGQLGSPSGMLGAPPSGGGWLGDGGASAGGSYAAPAARSGGWLGDSAGGPSDPPPLSMPPLTAPELSSPSTDVLALPDHTVAVDLGTPWEGDGEAQSASNQMIYIVLACLVLSLTAFSGYVWWQRKKLQEPVKPVAIDTVSAADVGMDNLRQAQAAFKAKKYQEAQSFAQVAFDLVGELKVATAEQRKSVTGFYRQATLRYASSLLDEAERASQNHQVNQATGMAEQAASMYRKLPDTSKEQAQAWALEGRIYLNSGDPAGALSAFTKANSLRPGAYAADIRQARAQGAPPPEVLPQTQVAQPLPPEEQPSIDPGNQVPIGKKGGGYRGHRTEPVPQAQPVGPAPKPRVNTYVPPKRDDRPSWRKKPSDRYPGS